MYDDVDYELACARLYDLLHTLDNAHASSFELEIAKHTAESHVKYYAKIAPGSKICLLLEWIYGRLYQRVED